MSIEKYKAFSTSELVKLISKEAPNTELVIHLNMLRLQGLILSVSETDMGGINICFQEKDSNAISYFHAAHILSIKILYPSKLADLLSEGEIPRSIKDDEKITQLQLKRWIKERIVALENVNENLSISIPDKELNDIEKLNIKDIVEIVLQVIKMHTKDEIGKLAWCQIESINLNHNTKKLEIKRTGAMLNISMDYRKTLHKELAIELENALLQKL